MKKFISILGSTGSIGRNTLKIIDKKKTYLYLLYFQQIKIIKRFADR